MCLFRHLHSAVCTEHIYLSQKVNTWEALYCCNFFILYTCYFVRCVWSGYEVYKLVWVFPFPWPKIISFWDSQSDTSVCCFLNFYITRVRFTFSWQIESFWWFLSFDLCSLLSDILLVSLAWTTHCYLHALHRSIDVIVYGTQRRLWLSSLPWFCLRVLVRIISYHTNCTVMLILWTCGSFLLQGNCILEIVVGALGGFFVTSYTLYIYVSFAQTILLTGMIGMSRHYFREFSLMVVKFYQQEEYGGWIMGSQRYWGTREVISLKTLLVQCKFNGS